VELECGPMPNVMAALWNIGAPSVQRRKVWLTPTTRVPCSNAAKTRNPLKYAVVPQTPEPISATSGPTFTVLRGRVEEVLLFNNFFRIVDTCVSCEDTAWQFVRWCADSEFLAIFLRPVFSASRLQHVSDPRPKFALRRHHVWKYGRHPICDGWD